MNKRNVQSALIAGIAVGSFKQMAQAGFTTSLTLCCWARR